MTNLTKRRLTKAEARFDAYEFGWEVEEIHHWHATGRDDVLCRTVLFRGESLCGPWLTGHFVVRFQPDRAAITECYAMIDGCLIGRCSEG
jgi:hypothetical protein